MKNYEDLKLNEQALTEVLKNLHYKFNKTKNRDVEFKSFEVELPKELFDYMELVMKLMKKHYIGLEGFTLTKASFIRAMLMFMFNLIADEKGHIEPKESYSKNDAFIYALLKDESIATFSGLRRVFTPEDEIKRDIPSFVDRNKREKQKPKSKKSDD